MNSISNLKEDFIKIIIIILLFNLILPLNIIYASHPDFQIQMLSPSTYLSKIKSLSFFQNVDLKDPVNKEIFLKFCAEIGIKDINSLNDRDTTSPIVPDALIPAHFQQIDLMSIEELEKLNDNNNRNLHKKLREEYLVPLYGKELIQEIDKYEGLIKRRVRFLLSTKKKWMKNLDKLEHIIYLDNEIKDGKFPDKEPYKVLKHQGKGLRNILNHHKTFIIRNRRVTSDGILNVLKLPLPGWKIKDDLKNALVHVQIKHGQIIRVYDKNMNLIYENQGMNVYINPQVVDGKITGAPLYNNVKRATNQFYDIIMKHKDDVVVFENYQIGASAVLSFKKKSIWPPRAGYENEQVSIFVKNDQVIKVINRLGTKIYPETSVDDPLDKRVKQNIIHPNALIIKDKDNKFTIKRDPTYKSFMVLRQQDGIREAIQKYPGMVIEKRQISPQGYLRLTGVAKGISYNSWSEEFKGKCKNALCDVVIENKEIIAVYDQDGNKVYVKKQDSNLYVHTNAYIKKNGIELEIIKENNSEILPYSKTEIKTLMKTHKRIVITNRRLGKTGLLQTTVFENWNSSKAATLNRKYWGKKVLIEIEDSKIKRIYAEDGTLLYDIKKDKKKEFLKQTIYPNTSMKNVKDKYKLFTSKTDSSYTIYDPNGLLKAIDKYKSLIVRRKMTKKGYLKIKNIIIPQWPLKIMAELYAGTEINIEIRNKEVIAVYDDKGNKIYSRPKYPLKVYLYAKMKNQKKSQHYKLENSDKIITLANNLSGFNNILEENPNLILTNKIISQDGLILIKGQKTPNWPHKEMKKRTGQRVIIEFRNKKIFRVFNQKGILLYSKPKLNIVHIGASIELDNDSLEE